MSVPDNITCISDFVCHGDICTSEEAELQADTCSTEQPAHTHSHTEREPAAGRVKPVATYVC